MELNSFYREIRTAPFRLTPDPRFFYGSETHRRALAYLEYGLKEGDGFVVLTGEVGTGKSTVIAYLLSRLDQLDFVVARFSTSQLDDHEVLRLIARAFELEPKSDDKAYLLDLIGRFIAQRRAGGQAVLLIVDEAQNLPRASLEELRMLTNAGPTGLPGLQCFLVGQSNFRDMLVRPDMEQLRQRVIASCHLEPLALEETQGYVEHRLSVGGWKGRPALGSDLAPTIHEATGGIPRLINLLLGRLLLFGALEQKETLEKSDCAYVIADLEADLLGSGTTGDRASGQGPVVADASRAMLLQRLDRLEAIIPELLNVVALLLTRQRASNADEPEGEHRD